MIFSKSRNQQVRVLFDSVLKSKIDFTPEFFLNSAGHLGFFSNLPFNLAGKVQDQFEIMLNYVLMGKVFKRSSQL